MMESAKTVSSRYQNIPVQKSSVNPATFTKPSMARYVKWSVLIWVLITIPFLLPYLQNPEKWQLKPGLINLLYSAISFYLLWTSNDNLAQILDRYYPWLKNPGRRLLISLVGTLVISFAIIMAINLIVLPLRGFNFSDLTQSDWAQMIYSPVAITFIISLFMHSRTFLMGWRQTAINAERLQKENIASQYDSLKSQVNPHFLFNSLNALTSLVETEPELAVRFIKQLSEVYRYVLDSQQKEIVPLADELKFVQSYIFLQQIRHGDNLQISQNIPQANHYQIAPLSVQMLLENAIKHNMILEDQPLQVKIYSSPNEYLVVENNLQIKNSRPDSVGMGLQNIQARYQYLTDKPVIVEQTEVCFRVKLPLLSFK